MSLFKGLFKDWKYWVYVIAGCLLISKFVPGETLSLVAVLAFGCTAPNTYIFIRRKLK